MREPDRTGSMLRCPYTLARDILEGIFALSLFGGGLFLAHEVFVPSGRLTETQGVPVRASEYLLVKTLGVSLGEPFEAL